MSEDDSSEKSHEPTQKKLDDARKKGEVAKSADLTIAAGYAGFILAAILFGAGVVSDLGAVLKTLIAAPDRLAAPVFENGSPVHGTLTRSVGIDVLPLFALPFALALLSILAQRALVFAPSKLEPKLSRISPISNAQQKFGRSGLFEFFKSFLKLSVYSVVLGIFLWVQLPRIMATLLLSPGQIAVDLCRMVLELMLYVLLVAGALGIVDAIFQHAEHRRKNMMSRKEIMDELKQSEGDPMMKQQRRDKAIQIATNRMLADVPQASVIIVNPTHYAVALKWDRSMPGAPVCLAKGVDEIAARIREIAMINGIPVHSDPPTARALHAEVEIGQEIRPDHYRAVAAAIRFAEGIRTRARA